MGILIFTDTPKIVETQLVVNELEARSIQIDLIAPWEVSMPDPPDINADIVYVPNNMLNRGSTFELIHRLLVLQNFERQAGTIINPLESILRYSKENLTCQLSRLNIPHPRTLITENVEQAYRFASNILDAGQNVVLKPLCRGRGVGVTMLQDIRSREDLLQFLAWYNRAHAYGVFYLQEFISNRGYDVRCLVIDGEVVGRERRSNPEDFRYNVSVGGRVEPFNDPVYDELAVEVTEAVGFKISGVDVLPGADGSPYVLEANCYPGFIALIQATKIPVHKKIVDYFQNIMKT